MNIYFQAIIFFYGTYLLAVGCISLFFISGSDRHIRKLDLDILGKPHDSMTFHAIGARFMSYALIFPFICFKIKGLTYKIWLCHLWLFLTPFVAFCLYYIFLDLKSAVLDFF